MPRQRLKARSDGRYSCRYRDKYFYGATQREAQQKRDEYKRLIESGARPSASTMTVREYAARWISTHKASVSVKCYNDYVVQLNALIKLLGDMRLIDVKPDDIKSVYTLHYINYSQSTIKRARMLYLAMFDAAVESGYAQSNPCRSRHAQPHKGTVGTHRAITAYERALIENTPHRCQLGALVMLYAGLRRGEVLALDRSDIDVAAKLIRVTKAVRFVSNKPIIDTPKTSAGVRNVPLLSVLASYLPDSPGLILPSAAGTYCSEVAFRRAWSSYLLALSNAAGREILIRPHDLRHSYCTMLRDAGVEMKLAMQWMGHADEKMILRVYDHVTTDRIDKSVALVEQSLTSCQNGCQNSLSTP